MWDIDCIQTLTLTKYSNRTVNLFGLASIRITGVWVHVYSKKESHKHLWCKKRWGQESSSFTERHKGTKRQPIKPIANYISYIGYVWLKPLTPEVNKKISVIRERQYSGSDYMHAFKCMYRVNEVSYEYTVWNMVNG